MKRKAIEKRVVGGEGPAELVITRAEGSFVHDDRGRKYIDFVMGWCVGNLGWNHRELAQRMRTFGGPDYVFPEHGYAPRAELAQLLVSIAPCKPAKCFRATGGSEAVDLALQAAMIHTGRRKFLTLEGSYHGNTLGALSIGSSEERETVPNLLAGCHTIEPPLDARALGKIETQLKRRDVAAFVMEPISINLGVLAPAPKFARGLQHLCRHYGTLLVMDEVATGFGRTGKLFASEVIGVEPDLLCLAKAITNGLAPMGALLARKPVAESFEEDGSFWSTYGWHPRSVHAAIATVGYFAEHEKRLLQDVARTSAYFRKRLAGIRFRQPAALRIQGLAICVDLGDEGYASKVAERCREAGLILTTEGSALLMLPALTIEERVAARGLDILERCV